jgi:hypothetical protein
MAASTSPHYSAKHFIGGAPKFCCRRRHREGLAKTVAFILLLGLVALAAWALWSLIRTQYAFIVRIEAGTPRIAGGKVTQAFLHEIGETCRRHGVTDAEIRGTAKGGRIALVFSGDLPPPCQQQLRNLWALSGWSAGSRQRRH